MDVSEVSRSELSIAPGSRMRRTYFAAVIFAAALVVYGVFRIPAVTISDGGVRSLAGAATILVLYAIVGGLGIPRLARRDPLVLRIAWRLGPVAGAIFGAEMLLEYIVLPADNTSFGYVEFGLVFLAYFAAAVLATFNGRTWFSGVKVSAMTAVFASLAWFILVLAFFYAFLGTERQTQVFVAEGNYEDFKRSGMTDFAAWAVEDFFGAGFFHLLLGPLLAGILGAIGGLLGMGLRRFAPRSPAAE